MKVFPAHWEKGARAAGMDLQGHLERLETPRKAWGHPVSFVLIRFDLGEHHPRWWASTSIMSDVLEPRHLEKEFGLSTGTLGEGVLAGYISLNPDPIVASDFALRYPEVPYRRAYEFVILHEMGHVVRSWKETDADRFAFERTRIRETKAGREKRAAWYESIQHPATKILGVP
jgi:hypothetical protein